jgi:hypothetical protein
MRGSRKKKSSFLAYLLTGSILTLVILAVTAGVFLRPYLSWPSVANVFNSAVLGTITELKLERLLAPAIPATAAVRPILADRIGVAHADGNYYFTTQPYLLEGAQAIQQLGSRVIKVFMQNPQSKYSFNSDWGRLPNLVDVLGSEYFQGLFAMDFSVYILQAHLDTQDSGYWRDGISDDEYHLIARNYYQAATYLLETYATAPAKKFIFEQWEADLYFELVLGSDLQSPAAVATAKAGLLRYFQARHEGIVAARRAVPTSQAQVFSAVELIYITSQPDSWHIVEDLDQVAADMISYSTGLDNGCDPERLRHNLDYLKSKLGGRAFYIGEMQVPEFDFRHQPEAHAQATLLLIDEALANGAEWVVLWQIYDNEIIDYEGIQVDRGFGLIRRDGALTPLYQLLKKTLLQVQ